ncbi:MAG: hypothetical protein AAGF79_14565 [Pseudomonadota bacterium]
MTTIVSRVFADEGTADKVIAQLNDDGHPFAHVSKISAGTSGLKDAILATRVDPETATVYESMLTGKATLVVVKAEFSHIGAARHAKKIMDATPSLPADVKTQNLHIREKPNLKLYKNTKILADHPLMLTYRWEIHPRRNSFSKVMHWKILSDRRPRADSTIPGTRYMSERFWPMPLLSRKTPADSGTKVMSGTRHMSKRFWPTPLTKHKDTKSSVLPGGPLFLTKSS